MARVGTTSPHVDMGGPALHGTFNRWTFHLWIHSDTAPAGSAEAALDLSNSSAAYDGGYLFDHPTASFRNAVYLAEAGGAYKTAQVTLKTKAWNAVTGRFDGTNLTNVTNLTIANTACADPSTIAPEASIFALPAGRGNGNQCFRRIGRVTLWDVPLSFSEVFFLQNGGDPKELTWRNGNIQFDYLMEADNFIDTTKRRNGTAGGTINYFPGPALSQARAPRRWPSAPAGGATRPVKMVGRWGGYAGASGGFAA